MSSPSLLITAEGRGVVSLTLNRAAARNALDAEMIEALARATETLDADPAVRLVLLRAAGEHFCAGLALRGPADRGSAPSESGAAGPPPLVGALKGLATLAKPTLALVHGACIGAGAALVAACDMVVASEDAFFQMPEVRLGFCLSSTLPIFIAALGPRALRRYGLSGERFGAAEARRLGMVHQICPRRGLQRAAAPIIEGLLSGGPQAILETKRLIAAGKALDLDLAARVDRIGVESRHSTEAAEGLAAFFEKRKPSWYPG